jgi:hypothetical protein
MDLKSPIVSHPRSLGASMIGKAKRGNGESGGALQDSPLLLWGQRVAVFIDPGGRDRAHAN